MDYVKDYILTFRPNKLSILLFSVYKLGKKPRLAHQGNSWTLQKPSDLLFSYIKLDTSHAAFLHLRLHHEEHDDATEKEKQLYTALARKGYSLCLLMDHWPEQVRELHFKYRKDWKSRETHEILIKHLATLWHSQNWRFNWRIQALESLDSDCLGN